MSKIGPDDVARVLDGYEAIRARDLQGVLDGLGVEPVVQTRLETYEGQDAVREYFEEVFQTDFSNDQDAIFVQADTIAAVSDIRIVGTATGIESDQRVIELWTQRPSQSFHLGVLDLEPGLEQLGLTQRYRQGREMREAFDAMNAGDHEPLMALIEPDAVLDRGEASLESDLIVGRDAIRAFLEPDVFETQSFHAEQVIATADRVLLKTLFRAKAAGSGIELTAPGYHVYTLRNGLAIRGDVFQEREKALALLLEPVS